MKMKYIKAHKSRVHAKRDKKMIQYIVIHYTANKGDTAEKNAKYFARSDVNEVKDKNNPRYGVGAHFFISKNGDVVKSIPMGNVAYAVGGLYSTKYGAGSYYEKCSNFNSVSIELCDLQDEPSWEQMLAVRELVKYIKKYCPNAKTVIRHWDVNGKNCPAPLAGNNNKKWKHLHNKIVYNYQFRGRVIKSAAIRSTKGVKTNNKIGSLKKGEIVKISKVVGNWGRLLEKKNGEWQWVYLKKIREV